MLVSDIQSDHPWISRAVSESTVVVQLVSQKSDNLWISRYIGQVDSFKYLGTVVTDQGSKPEVLSRIAQTTAALARLKTIWSDKQISVSSKIRQMRSLVISVLLYACETWTLTADILKKLQATEMRCFRKLLGISYRDHITNDAVRDRIKQAIGPYDDTLTTVKKRKLKWFGYVSRSSGFAKTILKEQCKEEEEGAYKRSVGRTISLNGQG